jgi:hypothetical protein
MSATAAFACAPTGVLGKPVGGQRKDKTRVNPTKSRTCLADRRWVGNSGLW